MIIIYDIGWYESHRLKAIQDKMRGIPIEILCPLCNDALLPQTLHFGMSRYSNGDIMTRDFRLPFHALRR